MKTLRAKLFTSIGTIFFFFSIINTVTSEIWIKKDLHKAGASIQEQIQKAQDYMRKFSSFVLAFHIISDAANLSRQVQMAADTPISSPWQDALRILSSDPKIAFVELQNDQEERATICLEDARAHPFSWAFDSQGKLWIRISGYASLFSTQAHTQNGKTFFFLFEDSSFPDPSSLVFTSTALESSSYYWEDSSVVLFLDLIQQQELWLEKIQLVKALLPWQGTNQENRPFAIASIDTHKNQGLCVITQEIFPSQALLDQVKRKSKENIPFLLVRDTINGQDLDVVKTQSLSDVNTGTVAIGFSLSALLREVSTLLRKPILVSGGEFTIGISSQGSILDLSQKHFPLDHLLQKDNTISWNGQNYVTNPIDLDIFHIFLLTPEEEANAYSRFFDDLSNHLTVKVSLTLMSAACLSFLIALLFLNNLSKKITQPIAALSRAAKTLSRGSYTDLILPQIHERQDEVATLSHSFEGMVSALKQRDTMQGILNKVVSKEISEKILQQGIDLGGEEKIVTLLFSDIRNFTHLAEGLPPHVLIEILNGYMTRMCRIIDETHGVVDKFIGDEIMTLYGAPLSLDFHAAKAVEAALLMMEDLAQWNQQRLKNNLTIFEMGIGIHTGLVYTGNMGAENRLNYTAIGANVNQASRICSIAKATQILISEETLQSPGVKERFDVRKLDPVQLKGIELPVQIYEVLGEKHSNSISLVL